MDGFTIKSANTDSEIDESGARALSEVLRVNNTLIWLSLLSEYSLKKVQLIRVVVKGAWNTGSRMNSSAVSILCDGLKCNTTLTRLSLGREKQSFAHSTKIKNKAPTCETNSVCKIGDEGAVAISKVLAENTALTVLVMNGQRTPTKTSQFKRTWPPLRRQPDQNCRGACNRGSARGQHDAHRASLEQYIDNTTQAAPE